MINLKMIRKYLKRCFSFENISGFYSICLIVLSLILLSIRIRYFCCIKNISILLITIIFLILLLPKRLIHLSRCHLRRASTVLRIVFGSFTPVGGGLAGVHFREQKTKNTLPIFPVKISKFDSDFCILLFRKFILLDVVNKTLLLEILRLSLRNLRFALIF